MYCVVERTSAVDSVTDEVKFECCGVSRQNQCNAGLQNGFKLIDLRNRDEDENTANVSISVDVDS